MLDLRPDHLRIVLDILDKHVPDRDVWAFGSRAKWTANDTSDLDLCVRGDAPFGFKKIEALLDAFSESMLPFKVDVVDWATTSETFRGIIERDRVVIQVKEEKEKSVERLPVTWRFLSIDEIKSNEDGAIAIGPFGSRMKADLYTDYGVPVIRGTNISDTRAWKGEWVYISNETADSMSNCNVKENDLVFPHRGSIGEVAIIPNDQPRYMLSTSLMKLRCDTRKANPLYVFYYFRSSEGRHQILKFASQVGTPGIGQPLTSLRSLQVPLPPIGEQHTIAHILGALDDKIELNRRMNADLEAMARALFKDWFVDFGPVRAKAEGRPAYLVPEIWDLFPDALDDEDKPVGWVDTTWGELAILEYGKRLTGYQDGNGSFPVFGTNGQIGWHFESLCNSEGIVIGRKGAYRGVHFSETPFFVIDTAFYLKPITSISIRWAYYMISRYDINEMDSGSAIPSTNRDAFYRLQVILPDQKVQSAFDNVLSPIWKQRRNNSDESQTLSQLRDLLLPKLITGEIRVCDAEKTVEAAP